MYRCDASDGARWYVVYIYSGYENKVKTDLEKIIENRNLESLVLDTQVPMEESAEEEDGKMEVTLKKKFPGYAIVNTVMTDKSWYVIRNIRGVIRLVGPRSKPVPPTGEEVESMGVVRTAMGTDSEAGETINIILGALSGFVAIIQEINVERGKIKASIDMLGRETLAELGLSQVEKLD